MIYNDLMALIRRK